MLEVLDDYQGQPAQQQAIREHFQRAHDKIRQPEMRQSRAQVAQWEDRVAAEPEKAFAFDAQGQATLHSEWGRLRAGVFRCGSLREFTQNSPVASQGSLRLFVLLGQSPLTDIGHLQAVAPPDSLFQVASQFNCLESPGPYLVKVKDYFHDPTQGPRASISAYSGTLLRHYSAPDRSGGSRFSQREPGPQIHLLHRVSLPGLARVESGYLQPHNITDPETFARLLEDHFEDLEVGHHQSLPVLLGANWDGPVAGQPLISQVFTSTLAAGGYGTVNFEQKSWRTIVGQLQRAAYLGTLLAAATTAQRRAVLTLIGGGVFGNPLPLIWESLLWACQEVKSHLRQDLTVIVNGRDLSHHIDPDHLARACHRFHGAVIDCQTSEMPFL